jgi:hypothetical protein
MQTTNTQIGRIIRVGRGWADVTVDRKVRRVCTRPDLLVRAGSYLTIVNDQGVSLLPENPRPVINRRYQ